MDFTVLVPFAWAVTRSRKSTQQPTDILLKHSYCYVCIAQHPVFETFTQSSISMVKDLHLPLPPERRCAGSFFELSIKLSGECRGLLHLIAPPRIDLWFTLNGRAEAKDGAAHARQRTYCQRVGNPLPTSTSSFKDNIRSIFPE